MGDRYYTAIHKNFKKWAPIYDAFSLPFKSSRRAVVAALQPAEGLKVLDVCTGTGAVAIEIVRAGASVTGIDLSEDMLRQAQRKHGESVRFLRMDATRLSFGPHEFDTATVSWGLHEMPLEIVRRVLQEIHRVTKRRLVVFDYHQPSSGILRALYRFIVGMYEGPFCMDFLNLDLPKIAREAGFELETERPVLAGACRLYRFRVIK